MPQAVRALSFLIFLTVAAATLSFALRLLKTRGREQRVVLALGALALLWLIHSAQLRAAVSVRMYALGVLLSGATSFLMWQAMRRAPRALFWWIAYGVASTAFALTHYFAFFTLFCQAAFFLVFLLLRWRTGAGQEILRPFAGWLLSVAVSVVLFLPWLPTFFFQLEDVRAGFWTPEVTQLHFLQTFWSWATGLAWSRGLLHWLLLLGWLGAVAWLARHADALGWFCLAQAIGPWVLCLAISLSSGRPLLILRYMVFAHYAFLLFLVVTLPRLRPTVLTFASVGLVTCLSLAGTVRFVQGLSWETPAVLDVVDQIKARLEPGDVCWVDGPPEVNRLLYYAKQAEVTLDVRFLYVPVFERGHIVHLASMQASDIFRDSFPAHAKRIWRCSASAQIPRSHLEIWRTTYGASFTRPHGAPYSVALWEKAAEDPK